MIFSGTMRDMKRRLRSDDIALDLEGAAEDAARLAAQLGEMPGLEARLDVGQTLVVRVEEGRNRADMLADVLRIVSANRLTLHAVRSGQNETENAYLQLLQEDQSHGFQRFALAAPPQASAPDGHPAP